VGEQRTRLPQSEPELAEKALALAYPQINVELTLEVRREGLAIPESSEEIDIFGPLS
jgi:hypothetical protein